MKSAVTYIEILNIIQIFTNVCFTIITDFFITDQSPTGVTNG